MRCVAAEQRYAAAASAHQTQSQTLSTCSSSSCFPHYHLHAGHSIAAHHEGRGKHNVLAAVAVATTSS